MGIGKPGFGRGEQHIAGKRKFKTTGNRNTIDCADHRSGESADGLDRVADLHRLLHRLRGCIALEPLDAELFQIETGGKCATGAGQNENSDIRIGLQCIDCIGQLLSKLTRQGIHGTRSIEGDHRIALGGLLDKDGGFGHVGSCAC